jgi:type 1 glutamine amidotransferase
MKEVRIEITRDGKVRILYSGFIGDECFREAQKLYALLKSKGVDVTIEQVTPTQEFYTQQQQQKSKVSL